MEKCKCGGELIPVAFNCEVEEGDLYDCFCSKCGEHRLSVEVKEKK